MPNPKRQHSRQRSRKRRTHWKIKMASLNPCSQCGGLIVSQWPLAWRRRIASGQVTGLGSANPSRVSRTPAMLPLLYTISPAGSSRLPKPKLHSTFRVGRRHRR